MVAQWYDLRLEPETLKTRVRTLPWASSGHVTTRSMSCESLHTLPGHGANLRHQTALDWPKLTKAASFFCPRCFIELLLGRTAAASAHIVLPGLQGPAKFAGAGGVRPKTRSTKTVTVGHWQASLTQAAAVTETVTRSSSDHGSGHDGPGGGPALGGDGVGAGTARA